MALCTRPGEVVDRLWSAAEITHRTSWENTETPCVRFKVGRSGQIMMVMGMTDEDHDNESMRRDFGVIHRER